MEKVQVKLDKCYTGELATQNIWESITQRFTYRPIDFDTQLALVGPPPFEETQGFQEMFYHIFQNELPKPTDLHTF